MRYTCLAVPSRLPSVQPLHLTRMHEAFDHPDWLYELKSDGFRAVCYFEDGQARLVSRNANGFRSFPDLCERLATALKRRAHNAILDGEIVCLDKDGQPQFNELLFRGGDARFYAFDVLWLNGRDLRKEPLIERKRRLRRVVPAKHPAIMFADSFPTQGTDLFRLACDLDLEGIVAKLKYAPYGEVNGRTSWLKIKNPNYSQAEGRHELFERSAERAARV